MSQISRREFLDWLGKGSVLALSSPLLAACGEPPVIPGLPWLGLDDPAPGFDFAPGAGDDAIFGGWGERTIDRQDAASIVQSWSLRVDGMVAAARDYRFADLLALARQDQITDFHCVEGWSVFDVPWNGLHLSTIAAQVRPAAGATHVTLHTLGGLYNESLPLAVALEPRTLLGYGIAGNTLPLAHGFPLRAVVPRLYGYKNAKYIERIEFTDRALSGYWVQRGYPYAGEVDPARLRAGKY